MDYDLQTMRFLPYFQLSLNIYGKRKHAFCILRRERDIGLIVEVEENSNRNVDLAPHLVAAEIAAFQGLSPDHQRTNPLFFSIGSFPTFYRIRVTSALAEKLCKGAQPMFTTHIEKHTPSVTESLADGRSHCRIEPNFGSAMKVSKRYLSVSVSLIPSNT